MSNHDWVARTSDTTHGHLSGCDDRGDAVGWFGFAPVEVVGHPLRSLRLAPNEWGKGMMDAKGKFIGLVPSGR